MKHGTGSISRQLFHAILLVGGSFLLTGGGSWLR